MLDAMQAYRVQELTRHGGSTLQRRLMTPSAMNQHSSDPPLTRILMIRVCSQMQGEKMQIIANFSLVCDNGDNVMCYAYM